MSIALSQQSFFFNALSSTHFPKRKIFTSVTSTISCRSPSDDCDGDSPRKRENQLAKLAMVTLAAGVLTLGSVHEASAAKTGGRIGGQAFRSAPPRASSPRINNSRGRNWQLTGGTGLIPAFGALKFAITGSAGGQRIFEKFCKAQSLRRGDKPFRNIVSIDSHRVAAEILTNIYVNPPVAPPLVGGYGFGYGVPFYGGWGWSPFSFFAPGPSVAIGVGGGFEVLVLFMFLGAVAAVIRRFAGSKDEDDDYY